MSREAQVEAWRRVSLEEVCHDITVGHVGPMADQYVDGGVTFLRSQNIEPFRLNLTDVKFITPEFHAVLRKSALKPGDVVVVRTGYPGTACVIPEQLRTANCADFVIIRPSPELDSWFLSCVFNSAWGRGTVAGNLVGVAQQHFNVGVAKRMRILLPPLPVQRRIASILSAYDDLIENNTRRIRVLEQMAQAIYREWFVNFRFPGHAKVKRVASPLGPIPQGWEVTTLGAVTAKIGSGATPRGGKQSYKSNGIALIRSLNVYDYRFEFADLAHIDDRQAAELDNVAVQEDDILLNITGASVARCALVPSRVLPARVNQHVAIVRAEPTQASPFYLLDNINSTHRKQQLLALAQGGATREALTKETISNFEIILPSRSVMEAYHVLARDIHRLRSVLQQRSDSLRHTRDLLLPRLLSGQLEIPPCQTE